MNVKNPKRGFARQTALLLACGLALAGMTPAPAGDGADQPILITRPAGAFAVTFPEVAIPLSAGTAASKNARVIRKQFPALLTELVRPAAREAFPESPSLSRVEKRIARVLKAIFKLQSRSLRLRPAANRPAADPPALDVMGIVSLASVTGLVIDESLSITLKHDGASWTSSFTERFQQQVGESVIQVDYTGTSVASRDAYLFAALVRDINIPESGVLILLPFDSRLPGLLEDEGVGNADVAASPIEVDFTVAINGSLSGPHSQVNPPAVLNAEYAARRSVGAAGAPPELMEKARTLLNDLQPGGN